MNTDSSDGASDYWGQFPARHRRRVGLRFAFATLMAFGCLVLPALGWVAGIFLLWFQFDTNLAAFSLGFGLLFLIFVAWVGRDLRDWNVCSIKPYFERKVGDIDDPHPYVSGHALARNCRSLDQICAAQGIETLSHFGFNDDMAGEELHWHDSKEGLATVERLLRELRESPVRLPDSAAIIADLEPVQAALRKADAKGIRFCLLLQEGDATCAMEHEQRKGSFF